jgi:hypothetical protein
MFLHGKDSARLEWGDTLNNPLLKEGHQDYDRIRAAMAINARERGDDETEGFAPRLIPVISRCGLRDRKVILCHAYSLVE